MKKVFTVGAVFLLLFASVLPAGAKEKFLMKDGKASCCIVLKSDDPAARHAAEELSLYLGKIAGGKGPSIGESAVAGLYPVTLELVKDKAIQEEGFALDSSDAGLKIQAKAPIGLIYGAYEVLKKYGKIRWLFPGEDGEYFRKMPDIVVTDEGRKVSNPSFPIRRMHFHSANADCPSFATRDWMLRNNLRLEGWSSLVNREKDGIAAFHAKRAVVIQEGWHCFTRLHNGMMTATDKKKWAEDYKKMFEEHPERFPLIAGKRRFLEGQRYQPCTSNKDNIRIIAENLVKHIRKTGMDKKGGRYIFVNNDNTSWCECDNCKAQADPRETKVGHISTRYWKFTNAVVAEARKLMGDKVPLVGYGYQNFQSVPLGVTPDPELDVMLSYNRICYRHNLDDPECPVNKTFFQYYKDWTKKSKNVTTWEEISESGNTFHPVEKSYANHLKVYYSLGMKGTTPSMPPPDGIYGPRYKGRMTSQCWRAMWQTMYMAAVLQWDITQDPDKVLEEANSLFFGKAWENGMREFRETLIKAASTTPGCFGHGHRAPIGRCLSGAGVHQKLKECLARAEKAAAEDPDKRALRHVLKDKEFFRNLWEKEREIYLKNFRELKAYPREGEIRIDGILDEKDWKNADIVTSFKINSTTDASCQTFVRIVHDLDNLYIAMEMMEPAPGKMISEVKNGRPIWEGNSAEVFINHPDMNKGYVQMIFNHLGDLLDAKGAAGSPLNTKYSTEAEYKVKVLDDRWLVEMRIPASSLGLKCFPGHTWLVNFQRYRVVEGVKPNESSSIAAGAGSNVEAFLPVSFAARRAVAGGMKSEIDTRYWKNGHFSETYKKKPYKDPKNKVVIKDLVFPYAWHDAGTSGYFAVEQHPERPNDNYMHLKKCRFYQLHKGKQSKFRFVLDAKGKGSLWVCVYRYTRTPKGDSGRHIASEYPLKVELTDKWTHYKVDYQKKDAREVLGVGVHANGEACIDNFFVLPMDEEAK